VGLRNSLLLRVDMVLYLCSTAEHTNGELSEQVANLPDQLGLHTLHLTSTAGRRTHHPSTYQGEDYW